MKTLLVYSELSGFAIQIKEHIFQALQELEIESKECFIEDVKQVSDSFQPTMTIFLHHAKRLYDYAPIIKELRGHKLLWSHECPYESDVVFDLAPLFYYIFLSDDNTANALRAEHPTNSIHYVPHACNPSVHKPMVVPYDYRSDICFVGNAYESRLAYLQQHAPQWVDKMVTLVGVGYRGLDGFQNQRLIHGHISEPEMVKYINGAKLNLNLHRLNSDLDMANKRNIQPKHLNNRFYEISACGSTQIVEGRDDMMEEIEAVSKMKPEDYSYKARLVKYYLPLLK